MRGKFLAASLAVLVTIAGSSAGASDHTPVSGEVAYAVPPAQRVAQWPPAYPDGARELRFRGTRTGPVRFQFDGVDDVRLVAGEYFINADSSDHVIVSNVDGDRVRLESPGEWEGAGIFRNSTYWGVFVYRDQARDRRNRGARGTHMGTLEPSGRLRVRGTFTNRAWPEFESSWTRLDPPRVGTVSLERLFEIPVFDQLEHSVWPPERARAPGPDFEHPVDSFEIVKVDGLNDSIAAGARAGERWTKDPVRVALEVSGASAQDSRSLDLRYDGNRGELPDSADVILVIDGYADDSVRGSWVWLRLARQRDDTWRLVELRRAWRCWRGHHQGSYSKQLCW